MSSGRNNATLRSFSYRSAPILDARKEESHPFHGMADSVLEEVADGAMEDASLALTAREAAGIIFLATASAAFLAGTDMVRGLFAVCCSWPLLSMSVLKATVVVDGGLGAMAVEGRRAGNQSSASRLVGGVKSKAPQNKYQPHKILLSLFCYFFDFDEKRRNRINPNF